MQNTMYLSGLESVWESVSVSVSVGGNEPLGGEVPRLNHGPIVSQSKTLKGVLWAIESQVPLFDTFTKD